MGIRVLKVTGIFRFLALTSFYFAFCDKPCDSVPVEASSALCENFLNDFVEKVSALRSPHSQPV